MKASDFNNISIRGRVAYCIKSLKNYMDIKHPQIDFASVYKLALPMVDGTAAIDEAAMAYMEIIPEYLYEFDNYEDAEFEFLTPEQYAMFTGLIPRDDDNLDVLMHRIYDVAMEYCYVAMEFPAKDTYQYMEDVIRILKKEGIEIPDINNYLKYTFSVYDGWGDFIDMTEIL
jgi:hypothetical protein